MMLLCQYGPHISKEGFQHLVYSTAQEFSQYSEVYLLKQSVDVDLYWKQSRDLELNSVKTERISVRMRWSEEL